MIRRELLFVVAATAAVSVGGANPVVNTVSKDNKTTPLVEINGKVATIDNLTSLSMFIENTEGRGFASGKELLDEYVLTELAEDVPSTAPKEAKKFQSHYGNILQRNMVKQAVQQDVQKKVKVTREEMEKWVKDNQLRYTQPERVHAYHIFMETADSTTSSPDSVKKKLLEVKALADKGTSFSELAAKYSEAASSKKGGEIGQISRRMPIGPLNKPMNVALEDAFFDLKKGQVSDVVVTSHGLHLLYAFDRETTKTSSVDDLIKSGVLPGTLTQDKLTSAIHELIDATVKKHNGKVLAGESKDGKDVLFELDGKQFTVEDFEKMYGERFARVAASVKENPERFKDLAKQALDDEAMVVAGVDEGFDKNPDFKNQFELIEKRGILQEALQNYYTSKIHVSHDDVKKLYEEVKNQHLQPETEGWLVEVSAEAATTATADVARARENAGKFAEELNAKAKESFNVDDLKKVEVPKDVKTSFTLIARHSIADGSDLNNRVFDQLSGRLTENNTVSTVGPRGENFYFAYLKERHPGNPAPIEALEQTLRNQLERKQYEQARTELLKELEKTGKVKFLPGAKELEKDQQY